MTESWVLIGLSPFFALLAVFGVIVVVALCQAETADVPTVFRDSLSIFKRLVENLPMVRRENKKLREGDDVPFLNEEVEAGGVDVAGTE